VSTLLLAPHADDETLFASYLAQRHAAFVVVVYDEGREAELAQATQWLGCRYMQLGGQKGEHEDGIVSRLHGLTEGYEWEHVIHPAEEVAGHEEHNIVARAAEAVFQGTRRTTYLTYAPRAQRSRGTEEFPAEPVHVARKLAALSCYRSQIDDPATAPWFYSLLDMREWTR
jgi:LmbE family N-acetylglucosaminyl deacetylase